MTRTGPGQPVAGIVWALAGGLSASCLLSLAKWAGTGLPAVQLTFIRYLSAFLVVAAIAVWRQGLRPHPGEGLFAHVTGPMVRWNVLRAILALTRLTLTFYAVTHMPFANAQAINLSNAPFMVLFAWLLLKERIAPGVMVGGAVALAGAVIVVSPRLHVAAVELAPGLAALAAAAIWGLEAMIIKVTSSRDNPTRILLTVNTVALLVVAAPALYAWRTPEGVAWWALAAIGPLAIATQYMNLTAFRLAPANVLAPFRYAPMGYGLAIGWLAFAEWPGLMSLAGMALIVAGGVAVTVSQARARPLN